MKSACACCPGIFLLPSANDALDFFFSGLFSGQRGCGDLEIRAWWGVGGVLCGGSRSLPIAPLFLLRQEEESCLDRGSHPALSCGLSMALGLSSGASRGLQAQEKS